MPSCLNPFVYGRLLTQMARKDMHFNNSRDTLKIAGDYQTADELWRIRERQTIVIQRFWRGFSARNKVWYIREEKRMQILKEMEEAAELERCEARRQKREVQRRMNPTTAQDFEVKVKMEKRHKAGEASVVRTKVVLIKQHCALLPSRY